MPRIDLPQLAVHAAYWAWLAALLAWWPAWPWLALGAPLVFWNYAVLHNHMHLPMVRWRPAAWLLSRTLGLATGFAYRGYYLHHFNHHRFDNGEGDWGRVGPSEHPLAYAGRAAIAAWLPWGTFRHVLRAAKTRAQRAEIALDLALVVGGLCVLFSIDPALGAGYFGMLLLAQASIHYLNAAAHAGCDAGQRARLAVTASSRWYNVLFFNAGYHQAHHLRPQAPWRTLPALTDELQSRGLVAPDLVTPLAPVDPRWYPSMRAPRGAA